MSSMGVFNYNLQPLHALFISHIHKGIMRCDLHVHSTASGMMDTPGLKYFCRESYSEPAAVYSRLKRLGMSLVTLTDHDSIDASETLRHHRDFFISEEATVALPTGTLAHLGVFGITERDHAEIQRRRNDFPSLLMYLTERRLLFCVNHLFSGLTGRRTREDFHWFASYAPAYETRNGQMSLSQNAAAEWQAAHHGKIALGGSDAHTLAHAGMTYTLVRGARTMEEFLAGLRVGRGVVCGSHGSYFKLAADVMRVARAMFCEQPLTLALLPLGALVPAFILHHWVNELRFCRRWRAALAQTACAPPSFWDFDRKREANLAS